MCLCSCVLHRCQPFSHQTINMCSIPTFVIRFPFEFSNFVFRAHFPITESVNASHVLRGFMPFARKRFFFFICCFFFSFSLCSVVYIYLVVPICLILCIQYWKMREREKTPKWYCCQCRNAQIIHLCIYVSTLCKNKKTEKSKTLLKLYNKYQYVSTGLTSDCLPSALLQRRPLLLQVRYCCFLLNSLTHSLTHTYPHTHTQYASHLLTIKNCTCLDLPLDFAHSISISLSLFYRSSIHIWSISHTFDSSIFHVKPFPSVYWYEIICALKTGRIASHAISHYYSAVVVFHFARDQSPVRPRAACLLIGRLLLEEMHHYYLLCLFVAHSKWESNGKPAPQTIGNQVFL